MGLLVCSFKSLGEPLNFSRALERVSDSRKQRSGIGEQPLPQNCFEAHLLDIEAEALRAFDDSTRRSRERPDDIRRRSQIVSFRKFTTHCLRVQLPATFHFHDTKNIRNRSRGGIVRHGAFVTSL
jgi:hypothetical protein